MFKLALVLFCAGNAALTLTPSALALESYDAQHEEVFARALSTGQASAVETYIAEEHPDLEGLLPGPDRTRIRPMSLVLTQLKFEQRGILTRVKPSSAPANEFKLTHLLLRFGAHSVYQETDLSQNTPMHLVFGLPLGMQRKIIGLLLRFHGDANLKLENTDQQTPVAIAKEKNPALGEFLDKHKPTGLSDYQIRSAPFAYAKGVRIYEHLAKEQSLANAVHNKDLSLTLKWLSQVSPDTYALYPTGVPLLHEIASYSDPKWIQFWIDHHAHFNIKNLKRQQVLHALVQKPAVGFEPQARLEMLLKAGAQIQARDDDGNTPLALAQKANQQIWVDLLVKKLAQKGAR